MRHIFPYKVILFHIEGLVDTTTSSISKLFHDFIPVKDQVIMPEKEKKKIIRQNLRLYKKRKPQFYEIQI